MADSQSSAMSERYWSQEAAMKACCFSRQHKMGYNTAQNERMDPNAARIHVCGCVWEE
jgi:hypothetical protein